MRELTTITPYFMFFVSFGIAIFTKSSLDGFVLLPEKAVLKGLTVLFYLGCIALHQISVNSVKRNLNFKISRFLEYLVVPWWAFIWLSFVSASHW